MIDHCIAGLDEPKDRRVTHPVRKEQVNYFPRPSQCPGRFLDTLLGGSKYLDEGSEYVVGTLHTTVRGKVTDHGAITRRTGRDLVGYADRVGQPLRSWDEPSEVWGGTEDRIRQSEVMKPFARSCLGSMQVNNPSRFPSTGPKAVIVQLREPYSAMDVNRLDLLPLHPKSSHSKVPTKGTGTREDLIGLPFEGIRLNGNDPGGVTHLFLIIGQGSWNVCRVSQVQNPNERPRFPHIRRPV